MSDVDTIVSHLNATLPTSGQAYPLGKVPGTRPDRYVEVGLSRRFGGFPGKGGAGLSRKGYRVTTRVVAQREANARLLGDLVASVLDRTRLPLSVGETTPVEFETEDPIAEDDGWYSGMTVWTYVAPYPDGV